SEVWGRMALRLANGEVFPFDFGLYAKRVGAFVDSMAKEPAAATHLDFGAVRTAQRRWLAASALAESAMRTVLASPASAARSKALSSMNESLRAVEQQFLMPNGI